MRIFESKPCRQHTTIRSTKYDNRRMFSADNVRFKIFDEYSKVGERLFRCEIAEIFNRCITLIAEWLCLAIVTMFGEYQQRVELWCQIPHETLKIESSNKMTTTIHIPYFVQSLQCHLHCLYRKIWGHRVWNCRRWVDTCKTYITNNHVF